MNFTCRTLVLVNQAKAIGLTMNLVNVVFFVWPILLRP